MSQCVDGGTTFPITHNTLPPLKGYRYKQASVPKHKLPKTIMLGVAASAILDDPFGGKGLSEYVGV